MIHTSLPTYQQGHLVQMHYLIVSIRKTQMVVGFIFSCRTTYDNYIRTFRFDEALMKKQTTFLHILIVFFIQKLNSCFIVVNTVGCFMPSNIVFGIDFILYYGSMEGHFF